MKRLGYISAIVIPLILFGFFISCDNAGGLSGYYIYALLDDTAYEWRLGYTNIEDDAFGFVEPAATDRAILIATPDVETGDTAPDNYVRIVFEGTTTGTYTNVIQSGYNINGVGWIFTDITLVVTIFEDVSGIITGTFSGTVEEEGDESMYWMELLVDSGIIRRSEIDDIYNEANEIVAMVVSSIKTAKKKNKT